MADTSPRRGEVALKIVSREQWGAMEIKDVEKIPLEKVTLPIDHVSFSYTGGETCDTAEECATYIRKHQKEDMDIVGLPDITYSFLIGGDGAVYEARGWTHVPQRPLLHEDLFEGRGVEIGYIGEFRDTCPPPHMLRAAFNFILYGLKQGYIKQTFHTVHLA